MSSSFLEIRNLTKSFGGIKAVDNLSLQVNRGEIFGFLGPNGAGKTTTIQMISGLLSPDSGEICFEGQAIHKSLHKIMDRIGVCTQQNILWEKLTCLEQLEFVGTLYHLTPVDARRKGQQLLDRLGLSEKQNQLAGKLSGGMQRRLNLALALVNDPELLILDEPEAGLDPQSRVMVREYISSMAPERTVLLTTHNMDEADRLSDRVAIIDHGRLLKVDTPENLKRTIGDGDVIEMEIERLIPEHAALLISKFGVSNSFSQNHLTLRAHDLLQKLPLVLDALQKNGASISELHMRSNSLEDVFITLTGRSLRE
jgi:ABC-2 type transport system ATP-binding protein